MKSQFWLQCSQVSVFGASPEPVEYSPHHDTLFLNNNFNIILVFTLRPLKWSLHLRLRDRNVVRIFSQLCSYLRMKDYVSHPYKTCQFIAVCTQSWASLSGDRKVRNSELNSCRHSRALNCLSLPHIPVTRQEHMLQLVSAELISRNTLQI
jgi:hypothetical protein